MGIQRYGVRVKGESICNDVLSIDMHGHTWMTPYDDTISGKIHKWENVIHSLELALEYSKSEKRLLEE